MENQLNILEEELKILLLVGVKRSLDLQLLNLQPVKN